MRVAAMRRGRWHPVMLALTAATTSSATAVTRSSAALSGDFITQNGCGFPPPYYWWMNCPVPCESAARRRSNPQRPAERLVCILHSASYRTPRVSFHTH